MDAKMYKKLKVGFGRADITPLEPCHMGGLGDTDGSRMSRSVLEPIYSICVAITDENDETVLLISNDLCQIINFDGVKEPISAATGVPMDKIYVAATHTHNAPALRLRTVAGNVRYEGYALAQMAVAAAKAMIDRKPAHMEIAAVDAPHMTFCRRYMNTEGGLYNSTIPTMTKLGPEEEPDTQLQVLKFVREGGKDILLTNFQGHYHGESTSKELYECVTPNFVGIYRDAMEEKTGCHVAYFSGAGGNLAVLTIYDKPFNTPGGYRGHGKKLAEYGMEAVKDLRYIAAGPIKTASKTYVGLTAEKEPDLYPIARQVRDRYEETGSKEEAMKLAEGYPIRSIHHAGAICRNMTLEDTFEVELKAISIGDLAIITAPCEMYSAIGEKAKKDSPFAATLVFQLTDGSIGYIPTDIAFEHGGYEPSTTRFRKGIAGGYNQTFAELLDELKNR